jgi:hypothetical protein
LDTIDAIFKADGTGTSVGMSVGSGKTLSVAGTLVVTGASSTIDATAIGATTADTGAFTTLSASSTVTLSGGTANGVTYLNGSKVVTSGSALTFDASTLGVSTTAGLLANFNTTEANGPYIRFQSSGTSVGDVGTAAQIAGGAATDFAINVRSTGNLVFARGFTEGMRLTSTGLGIGTSSPSQKLTVDGNAVITSSSADRYLNITAGNTYNGYIQFAEASVDNQWAIGFDGDGSNYANLQFRRRAWGSALTAMTLDTSGNLGLGVTPSAWISAYKALEIGTTTGLYGRTDSTMEFALALNGYRASSGSWIYRNNGAAARYNQNGGAHWWDVAASGTAGNAITFTQAMSLTAAGDLLVGTTDTTVTNGAFVLQGSGAINSYLKIGHKNGSNSGADFIACYYNGTQIGGVSQNGTTAVAFNTSSDYRLKNITGSITTSGAYIDSLNPVEGTWKADGSTFVGLIAHEVQEASRTQVATGTKDGAEMQAMDYSNPELIANLIAEVKSLRQRVATLEAK